MACLEPAGGEWMNRDSSVPSPTRPDSGPIFADTLPILGAITLFGLGLRLFNLGTHPLWLDEALSLHFARLPWYELLTSSSTSDPNPHFYCLFLKAWSMLVDSEFLLRLPSALAGTLVIPLTFTMARQLSDRRIGLLAAALVATSALQLRYSQEVRPYAIMTLAAVLAIWGLVHLLPRHPTPPGHAAASEVEPHRAWLLPWLAYTGGTAIALQTHNSMVLLLACSNGIALACWLLSHWWPMMLQRTLLWPALMVTILVAAGCASLKFRPAIQAVITLLLAVQAVADFRLYRRNHRAPWDQVARFVRDGRRPG